MHVHVHVDGVGFVGFVVAGAGARCLCLQLVSVSEAEAEAAAVLKTISCDSDRSGCLKADFTCCRCCCSCWAGNGPDSNKEEECFSPLHQSKILTSNNLTKQISHKITESNAICDPNSSDFVDYKI